MRMDSLRPRSSRFDAPWRSQARRAIDLALSLNRFRRQTDAVQVLWFQASGWARLIQLPEELRGAGDVAAQHLVTAFDLGVAAPAFDLKKLVQEAGGKRGVGVEPAV
jgi:hypothetical protein